MSVKDSDSWSVPLLTHTSGTPKSDSGTTWCRTGRRHRELAQPRAGSLATSRRARRLIDVGTQAWRPQGEKPGTWEAQKSRRTRILPHQNQSTRAEPKHTSHGGSLSVISICVMLHTRPSSCYTGRSRQRTTNAPDLRDKRGDCLWDQLLRFVLTGRLDRDCDDTYTRVSMQGRG